MSQPRSPVYVPDIVRTIKAARAAGLENVRVEVTRIPGGGVTIAVSGAGKSEPAAHAALDQWIASRADQA